MAKKPAILTAAELEELLATEYSNPDNLSDMQFVQLDLMCAKLGVSGSTPRRQIKAIKGKLEGMDDDDETGYSIPVKKTVARRAADDEEEDEEERPRHSGDRGSRRSGGDDRRRGDRDSRRSGGDDRRRDDEPRRDRKPHLDYLSVDEVVAGEAFALTAYGEDVTPDTLIAIDGRNNPSYANNGEVVANLLPLSEGRHVVTLVNRAGMSNPRTLVAKAKTVAPAAPLAMPDKDADIDAWIVWAKAQPKSSYLDKLIAEAEESKETKSTKDDKGAIEKFLKWFTSKSL